MTYGSTAHSNARAIGVGGRGGAVAHPADNMDRFAGMTLVANYAMAAHRHMHEYGTTSEQLAEISVATRYHAMRNPEAVKAMEDLEFLDIRGNHGGGRGELPHDRRPVTPAGMLHDLRRRVARW